jgi:hypothetical protein
MELLDVEPGTVWEVVYCLVLGRLAGPCRWAVA